MEQTYKLFILVYMVHLFMLIINGYKKHVTLISFEFFLSLLMWYHSSLTFPMIVFPVISSWQEDA